MVRRTADAAFVGGAHVFPGGAVDDVDGVRAAEIGEADAAKLAAIRELLEEAAVAITEPPAPPRQLDSLRHERGSGVYAALDRAGLKVAPDRLELISNWVTPPGPPRRFDTRFYVTEVAAGTPAAADGVEVFDAVWVAPARALAAAEAGEWHIIFPTRKHLELLCRFETPQDALEFAAGVTVERIEPRMIRGDRGGLQVLVPGDAGYEEAQ